jgi:hypothetical protein
MYKSLEIDLQTSLHLEGQLQEAAYATVDHREAVDSFLHKKQSNSRAIKVLITNDCPITRLVWQTLLPTLDEYT